MGEFALIDKICQALPTVDDSIRLGVGDDAAVVTLPADQQLAISTDSLIAGVHFFFDDQAEDIGYKSLAVNLSDMAAMGADPRWFTLALSLPDNLPDDWINRFCDGINACLSTHAPMLRLIGGDTTSGPLSITITMHGCVPDGQAISRGGACLGDDVYVSGQLGAPMWALHLKSNNRRVDSQLEETLLRPKPQVHLGKQLRNVATAMLDISDGLMADLEHIAKASAVKIEIHLEDLPIHPYCQREKHFDLLTVLGAGDEYQLAFTASPKHRYRLRSLAQTTDLLLTRIGRVTTGEGVACLDPKGNTITVESKGWRHF